MDGQYKANRLYVSMIFYMKQNETVSDQFGWVPYFEPTVPEEYFKHYKFKIGNKIYSEDSADFRKALKADTMWDQLLYRHPID